jgi:hypothetical protein
MQLGTMFGMIFGGVHYPERHHSLTHSLEASFHSWVVLAAAAAEEVGRVSVESGVDL